MAKQSTKIKKYVFAAGRAGAVGLLLCGLFWTLVFVLLLCVFGCGKPFWLVVELCCIVAAILFFAGSIVAWKQFGRMARNNKQQELKEDELELERDFVLITCPKCNGSNKIRRSTVEKCRYCDTYLQG